MFCPACLAEYPDDWKRCPKDEAALLSGRYLSKYRIDGLLGAGGMGAVYRAFNPDTKSPVAIKVLHPHASEREGARARFQREAAAVAALRTRHVIGIFDFGSADDGTLYLVMELLDGHNLREEIARGALALARVHTIMQGMLRGLGSAHRAGVTHRDLKPENIFLADTDDGEVTKVLDFGIARVDSGDAHALTQSGALMGTPAYMAPEQIAGNRGEIGPATDVYAAGIILYEMLTGAAPFAGDSITEVLSRVLTREFEPLDRARPDLPAELFALAERAMADDYRERFANADELRKAWQEAMQRVAPGLQGGPVTEPDRPAQTGNDKLGILPTMDSAEQAGMAPTLATPVRDLPPAERLTAPNATAGASAGADAAQPSSQSMTPESVVLDGVAEPRRRGTALWVAIGGVLLASGAAALVVFGGGGGGGSSDSPAEPESQPRAALLDTAAAAAPVSAPPDASPPAPPEGMVRLGGGTFDMGVDPAQYPGYDYDPLHAVEVAPFWLDRTEMTVARYRELTGADAEGPADHPVRRVSWHEASEACATLGRRLPTEAEWELAATRSELAAAGARLRGKGKPGPAPVGTHPGDCTAEGVCDLLGNVMEWTADGWREKGAAPDHTVRTVRGASYTVAPSARWYATPYARLKLAADQRDPEIGFRCARDDEPR